MAKSKRATGRTAGVAWLPDVERHDYAAALSYLALLFPDAKAAAVVARLRSAKVRPFKAKDIFRASRLPLLASSNSHVAKDAAMIRKGQGLSPILLVRNRRGARVEIADGYHRLCAVYLFDEDAPIACKIV